MCGWEAPASVGVGNEEGAEGTAGRIIPALG